MRARTNIGRHSRKTQQRRSTVVCNYIKKSGKKRTLERTPIKSPFKSPLYKARPSPASKRQRVMTRSARTLFDAGALHTCDNASGERHCERLVEEFNTLSSSTVSGVEEDQDDVDELPIDGIQNDKRNEQSASSFNHELINEQAERIVDGFAFDEHGEEHASDSVNKMKGLIPAVMRVLSERDGLDVVMTDFFEMVANGSYPLDNIAFLLWTEVVKWFKCTNTTQMRYTDQTKLFWKLGWRMFGKRFLNYMGGFKSHGEVVLNKTNKGYFNPNSSDINFAVPDPSVLRDFDPYNNKGARKPGIFEDSIQLLSENLSVRSACITFDGKKIKQGLTDDTGDVDLLGHEKGQSLSQRRDSLEHEIINVQKIRQCIELLAGEELNLDVDNKNHVIKLLQNTHAELSEKVNEILKLKEKKTYCKQKLIERGGDSDWRKGRYAFAISAVTAFIYTIDEFIKMANSAIDNLCRHVAYLNGSVYTNSDKINIMLHESHLSIDDQKCVNSEFSTRLIPQRSDEWHKLRDKALVTGSTLYKAVGCDGLSRQKDHFEKVICGVAEKNPSEVIKQAMQHGIDNEENAVGTVVGKVLPVYEPNLKFCEEGCVTLNDEEGNLFMVVSPDGSLRKDSSLNTTQVAIELKCPTIKVHTEFPERYLLQCLAEIRALDVQYLLYVSWTSSVTTVFEVSRNDELLRKSLQISKELYGAKHPKKPTKLTKYTKDLKEEIKKESKAVKFIGRFPSCTTTDKTNETNIPDNSEKTKGSLCILLTDICRCYKECYNLQRERATEAVVFLVGDLDRSWKKNTLRCSPVGWFPKGYSLDTSTMRSIAEEVHTKCAQGGIHVPCESFDGQWHVLVVRDYAGRPLTVLQLQKDVWKKVEKVSKKEIVGELKDLNKTATWKMCNDENNQRYIIATNGGTKMPKFRYVETSDNMTKGKNDQTEIRVSKTTLMDIVPDVVRETTDVGVDVLAVTAITDDLEMEAFSNNTNTEEWSRELQVNELRTESTEIEKRSTTKRDTDHTSNIIKHLDLNDMKHILSMFKTTKDCNKKLKWNNTTACELLDFFSNYDNMCKLLNIELRIVVRYLKKTKGLTGVKESGTKKAKLEQIATFLSMNISESSEKKDIKRSSARAVSKLQDLATKIVSKYSKQQLNVILAEYKFENEYALWSNPIENITINGARRKWFYKPEYSTSRDQVEVKCIDSTHLLTRARRKTCAGGMEGLTNIPWIKVAKQKSTLLTPIMVEEITDPMSVSMAKTHFSEGVENSMRRNGDIEAAELCSDIRNWWEAEDMPGIPAASRSEKRESLRRRLLSKVKFARFPPPTQYVCGWPIQLWEGLLASIDAKDYLYAMVHGGTYNVRAFSSLVGETFFSELSLCDKRGQGTVSALEFAQYVGQSTEQLQIRLDQDRKFVYCTSKTKVYDVVDESYECESEHNCDTCRICDGEKGSFPNCISTRDHLFDLPQRKRLEGRRKTNHVPLEMNTLMKGSLGVRWEKARCNMSKMLPTKRMGITDT